MYACGKPNKRREVTRPPGSWTAINGGPRDGTDEHKALADLKDHEHVKPHALRRWLARDTHRDGAVPPDAHAALGRPSPITTYTCLGLSKPDTGQMPRYASRPAMSVEEAIDSECAVVRVPEDRSGRMSARPERAISPRPRRIAVR